MSDTSSPGPTPPSDPSAGRPSRRLSWTGIAIVLLSIAVVAVATLLVVDIIRDRNAEEVTLTTTSDDALRAEVTAAIENYFATVDEAYATGDPSKLDGLYPEGSALGETQKEGIQALVERGQVLRRETRVVVKEFESLSSVQAQILTEVSVDGGEVLDAESGNVEQSTREARASDVRLVLRRQEGAWVIEQQKILED